MLLHTWHRRGLFFSANLSVTFGIRIILTKRHTKQIQSACVARHSHRLRKSYVFRRLIIEFQVANAGDINRWLLHTWHRLDPQNIFKNLLVAHEIYLRYPPEKGTILKPTRSAVSYLHTPHGSTTHVNLSSCDPALIAHCVSFVVIVPNSPLPLLRSILFYFIPLETT